LSSLGTAADKLCKKFAFTTHSFRRQLVLLLNDAAWQLYPRKGPSALRVEIAHIMDWMNMGCNSRYNYWHTSLGDRNNLFWLPVVRILRFFAGPGKEYLPSSSEGDGLWLASSGDDHEFDQEPTVFGTAEHDLVMDEIAQHRGYA